jgi:3-hydroxyisobutyrate dehydrogenase-like beta-hydroxyacid dehydrogenase
MRVALLGLGAMGRPMAANLVASEHDLVVWNRTPSKADGLEARVADSPGAASEGADLVLTMLSDDEAVEAVLFGEDGVLSGLAPGATHACTTTISAGLGRRLAAVHGDRDQRYVSAPVFGRPNMAAAASLLVVVGGPAAAIEAARPVLDLLSRAVIVAGDRPEHANVMKLAGNFMLGAAIEAMAEAYALVRAHGVSTQVFHETMAGGLFRSAVYERYGGMIQAEQYEPAGFALRHGLKDLRYGLAAGDEGAVPMPLAGLLHHRLLSASARGWGDADLAVLGRVAAVDAGQEAS